MSQQLGTHVTNRFGGSTSEFLIGLTRNFSRGNITIDSSQLGYAVNDVYAAFKVHAGVEYDDSATTNPDHYDEHIMTGVICVVAKLKQYTGQPEGDTEWEGCKTALRDMAKVGSRDRTLVRSTSGVTESDENPNGGTVRPEFDPERLMGYVPNDPASGSNVGGLPG